MKKSIAFCVIAVVTGCISGFQDTRSQTEREVVAMERASLDGWLKGDSGPALAASDADVTMFHVMTERRVEGAAAMKAIYDGYAGRPLFDSYQMESPKVQGSGDVAVLSYILAVRNGDVTGKYNATQVYQHQKRGWRLIHTHFSATAGSQP